MEILIQKLAGGLSLWDEDGNEEQQQIDAKNEDEEGIITHDCVRSSQRRRSQSVRTPRTRPPSVRTQNVKAPPVLVRSTVNNMLNAVALTKRGSSEPPSPSSPKDIGRTWVTKSRLRSIRNASDMSNDSNSCGMASNAKEGENRWVNTSVADSCGGARPSEKARRLSVLRRLVMTRREDYENQQSKSAASSSLSPAISPSESDGTSAPSSMTSSPQSAPLSLSPSPLSRRKKSPPALKGHEGKRRASQKGVAQSPRHGLERYIDDKDGKGKEDDSNLSAGRSQARPKPGTSCKGDSRSKDHVKSMGDAWIYCSRPEIDPADLEEAKILVDRHEKRGVRQVLWRRMSASRYEKEVKAGFKPAARAPPREKFALKLICRGGNDEHVARAFNEKAIMLALAAKSSKRFNAVRRRQQLMLKESGERGHGLDASYDVEKDNEDKEEEQEFDGRSWHTKLVNSWLDDHSFFMLLEYADKGSLDQHLKNGHGVRGGTHMMRFVVANVILALEFMHGRGIVHRDLKPGNLLVDKEGFVQVCDYGLSKFLAPGETSDEVVGTWAYISPQMAQRSPYGAETDLWSLGVVGFELAYGMTPFEPELNNTYPRKAPLSTKDWRAITERNILNSHISFPNGSGVPMAGRLFLKGLLERTREKRLGSCGNFKELYSHSFLTGMEWAKLRMRHRDIALHPAVFGIET